MIRVMISHKNLHQYKQNGLSTWWEWCHETFGPPNNSQFGAPASEQYWGWDPAGWAWFCNPEHATLFALRWA
jgi:hypothetical protein